MHRPLPVFLCVSWMKKEYIEIGKKVCCAAKANNNREIRLNLSRPAREHRRHLTNISTRLIGPQLLVILFYPEKSCKRFVFSRSARSSFSHLNLILIHPPTPPLFQITLVNNRQNMYRHSNSHCIKIKSIPSTPLVAIW